MKKDAYYKLNKDPDIILGFRRTIGEIEWLLLALVLFFLVVGDVDPTDKLTLVGASCCYAGFVMAFQYLNFFRETKHWKIAFQTWVMIFFISWLIWYTGKLQSPLFNLYLLPILASAIALGKLVTLLEVGLVFSIFMFLEQGAAPNLPGTLFDMVGISDLLMLFFPMLLVAYVSTMLTSDIQMGYNRLRNISETDELTQLLNHRAFKVIAGKTLQQATRHQLPVALLMLDLDNLKTINDKFGHQAGNLLLVNISNCLTAVLRDGDIAARYGGDEFIIVLPNCDEGGARKAAERIVEEFNIAKIRYQSNTLELSASIGIACFPDHAHSLENLVAKADQAMYISKQNRKGTITVYRPELIKKAS